MELSPNFIVQFYSWIHNRYFPPQWELYFSNLVGLIPPHSIALFIIHFLLLSIFCPFFAVSLTMHSVFIFFLSPASYLLLCKLFKSPRFSFWKSLLFTLFIEKLHLFFSLYHVPIHLFFQDSRKATFHFPPVPLHFSLLPSETLVH